jgi:Ca2+-binding RTX toxin-like protein
MFSRIRIAVAATVVVGLSLFAQPAAAMRTYVDYDSLVISAAPGETNSLSVVPDPDASSITGAAFLISDPGATITPGRGCTATLPHVVRCQTGEDYQIASLALYLGDRGDTARVQGLFYYFQVEAGEGADKLDLVGGQLNGATYVRLGGGNDILRLHPSESHPEVYGDGGNDDITAHGYVFGGDGNDTLTGSSLVDNLFGDAGDDTINSYDGWFDAVYCGAGSDALTRDAFDYKQECEQVVSCPAGVLKPLQQAKCVASRVRRQDDP